jgi:hypothetical protein
MSSLLRPQLTHRSPLNWQTEMHGFSISLAIVNNPWSRLIAQTFLPIATMSALALLLRVESDRVI